MIISYMATEKIAITVDAHVLAGAERMRRKTGESRSALFSRAVAELLRNGEHVARVKRYVEAYREQPESPEEVQAADALASEALRHAPPWDDG